MHTEHPMKAALFAPILAITTLTVLAGCGDDEKTTVIERQPIVVQQPAVQPVVVHDND